LEDRHVLGERVGGDQPRVAAAEVEMLVVQNGLEGGDHLGDAAAEPRAADTSELGVADALLVGLALLEGMVTQLEVGHEPPIDEERRAEAGAEREDELHATTP